MRELSLLGAALSEGLVKALQSRKFLAAVAAFVGAVCGVDPLAILTALGYITAEGIADIKSRPRA